MTLRPGPLLAGALRGWLLAVALMAAGLGVAAAGPAFDWRLPPGVEPPPVPADNPMSDAKAELGRRLFYDADLSIDGTLSCATCHEQHRGFAEPNPTRPGVKGALGRRNVMGLANVAYLSPLTWADPGQARLEDQVSVPVLGLHPVEMGMHGEEAEIVRRLSGDACYRQMFAAAFPEAGGEISFPAVTKAIGAFQRTLLSWNSPWDRRQRGEAGAMTAEALRGEALFREKGCAGCHAGPQFTDQRYHRVSRLRGDDLGAFEHTGREAERGVYRTPSLRNAALTGPYLHDGAAPTLRLAIIWHEDEGRWLTGDDLGALEAFLGSLTDMEFVKDPRFSLPRSFCGKAR